MTDTDRMTALVQAGNQLVETLELVVTRANALGCNFVSASSMLAVREWSAASGPVRDDQPDRARCVRILRVGASSRRCALAAHHAGECSL